MILDLLETIFTNPYYSAAFAMTLITAIFSWIAITHMPIKRSKKSSEEK